MNFDTMKPVMAPKELTDKYTLEPPLEMEYAGRKIHIEGDGVDGEPILVRMQHLDSNLHVNNAQYVSMAVDSLPQDFQIGGLRVEYKKQAHLNDTLYPHVIEQTDGRKVVSLRGEEADVYVNVEFTSIK